VVAQVLGEQLMARRHHSKRYTGTPAWVDEVAWGCATVLVAAVLVTAVRRGAAEIGPALFVLLTVFIIAVLWISPYQRSR
jgi:hypothetical protein